MSQPSSRDKNHKVTGQIIRLNLWNVPARPDQQTPLCHPPAAWPEANSVGQATWHFDKGKGNSRTQLTRDLRASNCLTSWQWQAFLEYIVKSWFWSSSTLEHPSPCHPPCSLSWDHYCVFHQQSCFQGTLSWYCHVLIIHDSATILIPGLLYTYLVNKESTERTSLFHSFSLSTLSKHCTTVILSTNPLGVTGTLGEHLSQGYFENEDVRSLPFRKISYDVYAPAHTISSAMMCPFVMKCSREVGKHANTSDPWSNFEPMAAGLDHNFSDWRSAAAQVWVCSLPQILSRDASDCPSKSAKKLPQDTVGRVLLSLLSLYTIVQNNRTW